jgi:hypothetical protein
MATVAVQEIRATQELPVKEVAMDKETEVAKEAQDNLVTLAHLVKAVETEMVVKGTVMEMETVPVTVMVMVVVTIMLTAATCGLT